MNNKLLSEEEVKEALNINKFSEMTKEKIMEFASLIPHMDKEVAIAIINQFPAFADAAKIIVAEYKSFCDDVIKENEFSQRQTIDSYRVILDSLSELLQKEELSFDERIYITEKMIYVGDEISKKDTENKIFLKHIHEITGKIVVFTIMIMAGVLGLKVSGKIPKLSH